MIQLLLHQLKISKKLLPQLKTSLKITINSNINIDQVSVEKTQKVKIQKLQRQKTEE